MSDRTFTVDARRLPRWVAGVRERHGEVHAVVARGGVLLTAEDGTTALLSPPFPDDDLADDALPAGTPVDDLVAALTARVLRPRRVAAVLARRGGYACAVVGPDGVGASKVGTRYVQGRTAAGGWSQQRFARRRENQTDDLVRATADHAARVLDPGGASYDAVVTGGDRTLVDRVLADPRLRVLGTLPRGPHLAVGDPRSDVVKALPEHVRSVTVHLSEP
ncbi:acVLRF1 family peptidyl-tRNA hydrolase [Kineosporia sp. R_H_3]|uniref:acVLRF1 family peptidyl-tRNA hydrolase n=1 Tax=Kineosporia sp. R_H_3 TaxID=1961848 RepID=UPI000B4BF370|nr:acVLRF1 family peptidyl-tRNA hydrolase [Kineosporia sp. R_H_3]